MSDTRYNEAAYGGGEVAQPGPVELAVMAECRLAEAGFPRYESAEADYLGCSLLDIEEGRYDA